MPANTIPSSPPAPAQRRLIAAGFLTGRTTPLASVAPSLNAHVHGALGFRHILTPRPELGETNTRICVWSIRELDATHARTGGTVTARQVERTSSDGSPYTVIEVTVTVAVPNVGPVEVFTDWEPAEEPHVFALPVIRAVAGASR